jgi:hypothetical protein
MEGNVKDETLSILQKSIGIQGRKIGKVLLPLFHMSKCPP